jgi:exopolyphosphatase/guanosine-5'-triphosphate,3'-diphosphate pyrophosphatase
VSSEPGGTPGAVAAIDCGTNSTRLLVAGADGLVLERLMRITRLGEGVDATRSLSPEAVARTITVLGEYRAVMDSHGVTRGRLVATSAVRDAANGDTFLAAAAEATGLGAELLSGRQEGELSFAGATAHLPGEMGSAGPILVVDIGGGSTELVVGEPGRSAVTTVSLEIGCVRLTERFLTSEPPRPEELEAAQRHVEDELVRARHRLPALGSGRTLVGLAGTVSTLAALELGLDHYSRERIHHAVLSRRLVDRWLSVLAHENRAARMRRSGMVEGRADVIVGGALVLASVMRVFHCDRCLVSEDDILDGMVLSLR